MIGKVLRVLEVLRPPLERAGVNCDVLKAIVAVKLTQDGRRLTGGRSGGTGERGLTRTLVVLGVTGGMMSSALLWVEPPLLALAFVHGSHMTILALMIVGDLTVELISTADSAILLPRPIDDRTLLVARTTHVTSYVVLMAFSLTAATWVFGFLVIHPLFPILYAVMLTLSIVFVICGVYFVYLLALQFLDLERFQEVLLWLQVVLFVGSFAGVMLILAWLVPAFGEGGAVIDPVRLLLYPPAWYVAPFEILCGRGGQVELALSALAVLVPLLGLWVIVRGLSRGFGGLLSKLGASAAASCDTRRSERLGRLARFWERSLTRPGGQRAAFRILWAIASRDRSFRFTVYPIVAVVLLGGLAIVYVERGGIADNRLHLLPLYCCAFIGPTVLRAMRFSEDHKAAWLWSACPFEGSGSATGAAAMVAIAKYSLTPLALVGVGAILIAGPEVLLDVVLAGSVGAFVAWRVAAYSPSVLPFSLERPPYDSTSMDWRYLLGVCVGAFGLFHWILLRFHPLDRLIPSAVLLAVTVKGIRCLSGPDASPQEILGSTPHGRRRTAAHSSASE